MKALIQKLFDINNNYKFAKSSLGLISFIKNSKIGIILSIEFRLFFNNDKF
jgi:hypothetical protein